MRSYCKYTLYRLKLSIINYIILHIQLSIFVHSLRHHVQPPALPLQWPPHSSGISAHFPDWHFKADLLSAVKLRKGHVDLPLNHMEVGVPLGNWLHKQVEEAQQGHLEAEKFDRLADLGVSFDEKLDGKVLEKDEDLLGW